MDFVIKKGDIPATIISFLSFKIGDMVSACEQTIPQVKKCLLAMWSRKKEMHVDHTTSKLLKTIDFEQIDVDWLPALYNISLI